MNSRNVTIVGCSFLVGLMVASNPLARRVYVSPNTVYTAPGNPANVSIIYDDEGDLSQPLKGYDIRLQFDPDTVGLNAASEGSFLGVNQFFSWDTLGTDTAWIVGARLDSGGATGSGALASVAFEGLSEGISPITFEYSVFRDSANTPITGIIGTDGLIMVDGTDPTMEAIVEVEGEYYSTAPSFANFGFDDNFELDDVFYQMDSYAGSWETLVTDVTGTEWNSDGWAIPGFDALSEGTHTIYFRATDDAGNEEGEGGEWSWQFYKDTAPPGDVTGFSAEPGHNKVSLSWTSLAGKQSPLKGILIRRVAWGDYPQYTGGEPGYPSTPTGGDSVTFLPPGETTYVDIDSTRDIYYYTAFAMDSAGNYSSAGLDAQDRATSYWLGDVTDVSGTVGSYDGYVDFEDLMVFSDCFGTSEGGAGWEPEFDIGPTHDNSRRGIPEPDRVINFEDLMIFAMNFWHTQPVALVSKVSAGNQTIGLRLATKHSSVGEVFEVKLVGENCCDAKGLHMVVAFDANSLEFIGVEQGDVSDDPVFFNVTTQRGEIGVDLAILGTDATMSRYGEIANFKFRLISGTECELVFKSADVRDRNNQTLQCQLTNLRVLGMDRLVPEVCALHQNYPNPFREGTHIRYQLPKNARVLLKVYDDAGKLIKRLVDERQEPGYYTEYWDGGDAMGNHVATGVYFCRLETSVGKSLTKKMVVIK